jgi:anti-anti-sigma factor
MEIIRQHEGVVQVTGDLHISEAEQLRSALLRELRDAPAMTLELSGVDSCDAATLQILFSLRKSAERDGKHLNVSAPSAGMRETASILGVSPESLSHISKS